MLYSGDCGLGCAIIKKKLDKTMYVCFSQCLMSSKNGMNSLELHCYTSRWRDMSAFESLIHSTDSVKNGYETSGCFLWVSHWIVCSFIQTIHLNKIINSWMKKAAVFKRITESFTQPVYSYKQILSGSEWMCIWMSQRITHSN